MQCFRCEPCGFNLCEKCFVAFGGVIETSGTMAEETSREGSSIRRALACFRTNVREPHPAGKGQNQDWQQGQLEPVQQQDPREENGALVAQQSQQGLQQQQQQQQQQVQPPGQPQLPPKSRKGKPSGEERNEAARHALAGGIAGFLRRSGRNVAAPVRPPPPETAVAATDVSTEAQQEAKVAVAGTVSQPPPLPLPTSSTILATAASARVQHSTLAQQAADVASSSNDEEADMRLSGNARPRGKARHGDLSRYSASSAPPVHMSRHSQQQQSFQEQHSRAGSVSHSIAAPVAGAEPFGAGGAGVVRPRVGIGGMDGSFASRRSSGRPEDANWNSHVHVEEIGQSDIGGAGSSMSSSALPMGTNQGKQNTIGLQQSRGRQSEVSHVKSQAHHSDSGVQQFLMSNISDDDSLGQAVNRKGNARPGGQASTLRSDTSEDVHARQDLTDISSVPSAHGRGIRGRETHNARPSSHGGQGMMHDSASDDDDDEGPSGGRTHYQVCSEGPPSRPTAASAAIARPGAASTPASRREYGTPLATSSGIQPFSPLSVSSVSYDGPATVGSKPPGPPTRTFQQNDMMEESVEST
eukprot:CAMPEP_0172934896 /NCGR_PEP_ID=MMETSP1075-20121228/221243_1 /TAXON_ID=2916 /ORGANISM="Ceratium fusus, Strain PA161109" /LENGTH=582 /DNA_ID=CAMNT_0013796255 /DNA_START=67 /DNA_END=1815 /DNA_ORIENTATION=+